MIGNGKGLSINRELGVLACLHCRAHAVRLPATPIKSLGSFYQPEGHKNRTLSRNGFISQERRGETKLLKFLEIIGGLGKRRRWG